MNSEKRGSTLIFERKKKYMAASRFSKKKGVIKNASLSPPVGSREVLDKGAVDILG